MSNLGNSPSFSKLKGLNISKQSMRQSMVKLGFPNRRPHIVRYIHIWGWMGGNLGDVRGYLIVSQYLYRSG
jgi:hypothetical protein